MKLFFFSLLSLISLCRADINWPSTVDLSPISDLPSNSSSKSAINSNGVGVVAWKDDQNVNVAIQLAPGEIWTIKNLGIFPVVGFLTEIYITNDISPKALVVWIAEDNFGHINMYAGYYKDNDWHISTVVTNLSNLYRKMSLAFNQAGHALLALETSNGIKAFYSSDGGIHWSNQMDIFSGASFLNVVACLNDNKEGEQSLIACLLERPDLYNIIEKTTTNPSNQAAWNASSINQIVSSNLKIDFFLVKINDLGRGIASWNQYNPDSGQDIFATQTSTLSNNWDSPTTFLFHEIYFKSDDNCLKLALNNSKAILTRFVEEASKLYSFTWDSSWDNTPHEIFSGQLSNTFSLSMNNNNEAVIGFTIIDIIKNRYTAVGSYSENAGITWSQPHNMTSANISSSPVISINDDTNVVGIWEAADAKSSNPRMQVTKYESSIFGKRVELKTLLQRIIANQLSWSAVNGAVAYQIYRDNLFINQTQALSFIDSQSISFFGFQKYKIYALKDDGSKSFIGSVSIGP